MDSDREIRGIIDRDLAKSVPSQIRWAAQELDSLADLVDRQASLFSPDTIRNVATLQRKLARALRMTALIARANECPDPDAHRLYP